MRIVLGRGSRTDHFLMGLYLSMVLLAISAITLREPPVSSQPDTAVLLGMLWLVAGLAFAGITRLERAWIPFVMILPAALATLSSYVYQFSRLQGDGLVRWSQTDAVPECSIVSVNRGFPIPWNIAYRLIGTRCFQLFQLLSPTISWTSFSLDVVFYAAAGLGVIQICRGILGKSITERSSSR